VSEISKVLFFACELIRILREARVTMFDSFEVSTPEKIRCFAIKLGTDQSLETKSFIFLFLCFRCGQETRVIPRILQLRSHWMKSEKESMRLQEAGISKEVSGADCDIQHREIKTFGSERIEIGINRTIRL
jgi:hypothetical protein